MISFVDFLDTSNKGLDSYYLKITKKERIKVSFKWEVQHWMKIVYILLTRLMICLVIFCKYLASINIITNFCYFTSIKCTCSCIIESMLPLIICYQFNFISFPRLPNTCPTSLPRSLQSKWSTLGHHTTQHTRTTRYMQDKISWMLKQFN